MSSVREGSQGGKEGTLGWPSAPLRLQSPKFAVALPEVAVDVADCVLGLVTSHTVLCAPTAMLGDLWMTPAETRLLYTSAHAINAPTRRPRRSLRTFSIGSSGQKRQVCFTQVAN
jgi:hypothetical protein